MIGGKVFKLEYSLKYNEATKMATELGYFHDLKALVVAKNVNEAVDILRLWHDDGKPEGIKSTDLGGCIKSASTKNPIESGKLDPKCKLFFQESSGNYSWHRTSGKFGEIDSWVSPEFGTKQAAMLYAERMPLLTETEWRAMEP